MCTTDQDRRLLLNERLKELAGDTAKVYYQPPSNVQIEYPAIVYQRDSTDTQFANNSPYSRTKRYQVTVIERSPKGELANKVGQLPMCVHERFFIADGLNQDVFTLYF